MFSLNKLQLTEESYILAIDPMHKWLPIKNYFVIIQISPTNLVFELIIQKNFLFSNEASWANFNNYKRIFNWQPLASYKT